MGGSTKPSPSTATSVTEPGPTAKPYYQQLFKSASNAFNATPRTPYSGPFTARPNATQKGAVQSTLNAAPRLGMGADAIRGEADKMLSGFYLDPSQNNFLRGAIDAAIDPFMQRFTTEIAPAISSAAQQKGAYGGARQGLMEGTAAGNLAREANNVAAALSYGNYADERARMQQAPGLYSAANTLDLAPAQAMSAAGDQLFAWDQDLVNEALAKWNEAKSAPWSGLGEWSTILGSGGFRSTDTTSMAAQPSLLAQLLQGGIGAAGALSGFGFF